MKALIRLAMTAIAVALLSWPAVAETGIASVYSDFRTACPPYRFDRNAMAVAHRTLPCGSTVLILNRRNGRSIVALVSDRGPCASPQCQATAPARVRKRILDLTPGAAHALRAGGLTLVTVMPQ